MTSLPLCFSLGLGIWGVVDEGTKTKLLLSSRLKVMNIVSTCMKILIKIFYFFGPRGWGGLQYMREIIPELIFRLRLKSFII